MKLPLFKLEDYLGKWEFKAPYLFCTSDMESLSLRELLGLADSECKDLWDNLRLSYTEVPGLPQLTHEISKLYTKIPNNQILTFSGAEEGIYSVFHALLKAQDHVIVVTPCYQSLEAIPKSIGCEVTEVPLNAQNQWKLDLSSVQKSIRAHTKLIIINFPHNPTGAILDQGTLQSLIDLARKNGIYLFSDEVYRFMEVDEKSRLTPVCDLYERGISLGVMSKAFGLAGLRIGWIATQDLVIRKNAEYLKHYLSICNSAPSEVLALIALRAKEKILGRNHLIMVSNLNLLDAFFQENNSLLKWTRPLGGCTAFPQIMIPTPVEDFAAQLVQETGVLVLPGSVYNWPGNHFRIGFGRQNMSQALDRFSSFLKKQNKDMI